jgi:hypothetical protein
MEKALNEMISIASRSTAALPQNEVAAVLQTQVEEYKQLIDVLKQLKDASLRDRHWRHLHAIFGIDLLRQQEDDDDSGNGDGVWTVGRLLDLHFVQNRASIVKTVAHAQIESVLEILVEKVAAKSFAVIET